MAVLNGIKKNKKLTLHKYIDMFTKVAVELGGFDDGLKFWIFKKGLRSYCTFREKL